MKDIDLVYFSPTGNTRKTLQTIAAGAQTQVIEHDRTYPQGRWTYPARAGKYF